MDKILVKNLTPTKFKKLIDQLQFWDHFEMRRIGYIDKFVKFSKEFVFEAWGRDSLIAELNKMGYQCEAQEWVEYEEECYFCKGTGIVKKRK